MGSSLDEYTMPIICGSGVGVRDGDGRKKGENGFLQHRRLQQLHRILCYLERRGVRMKDMRWK